MESSPVSHHPLCSLDFVLELISARWAPQLIRELRSGPKRPSELVRSFPRISAKTLTQRLRELEEAGFIRRQAFDEIPPRVEYSLTDMGNDLMCVLEALTDIGQNWRKIHSIETAPEKCKHCENVKTLELQSRVAPSSSDSLHIVENLTSQDSSSSERVFPSRY